MSEHITHQQSSGIGAPHASAASNAIPSVRFPIRTKIVFPYFLLSMLLAVGALFLALKVINFNIAERFNSQLQGTGKLATEWMPRETDRMLETLRLLANAEGIAESIQTGDAEGVRKAAYGITVDHLEEAVEFLDTNGELVLSMRHRAGGNIEEYEFGTGGVPVYRDWEIVTPVLAGQSDGIGNKYGGLVHAAWGDYMYIAGPVYGADNRLAGVVLVGQTLQSVVRKLHESTLAQITFYDPAGKVIASTFYEPVDLDSEQVNSVLSQQDTASGIRVVNDQQPEQRELDVANTTYTEILGAWETRNYNDLGILGVSLFNPGNAQTSIWDTLLILSLALLAFVMLIVVGIVLSKSITRPLLNLVTASLEVSRGDLNVRVQEESQDEIAVLSGSFNQMVEGLRQSRDELVDAWETTIEGWAKALGVRDNDTELHCERVTAWTVYLARQMGIPDAQLMHVRRGALLHDIGKIGVPDRILFKPGKLDDEEWVIMKQHVAYGIKILGEISHLHPAINIPKYHHEKWDGSGYPHRLSGDQIPLEARIFAIVDVWDALTNDRPYRKAMTESEAVQIIQQGSGTHFDPRVVATFIEHLPALTTLEIAA